MKDPVVTTPITRIEWPSAPENRFFLKRDDLQPYSFGGNKVRIGWEFLKDLKEKNCSAMLMYGSLKSNLCRVLAGMCRAEGIPARMIAPPESGGSSSGYNMRITRLYGVPVRQIGNEKTADVVEEELEILKAEGLSPYYIYGSPHGTGNEGTAARAYAKAYAEILRQEEESGIHFDLIAVPYGTGATQGGLIAGAAEAGDEDRVLGISISSRTRERAERILEDTVYSYLAEKGAGPDRPEIRRRMHLETRYNCGGYGITDPAVTDCVREMLLTNAVPMAPEYSGKAFLGLCRCLKERDIKGKNILFIHTGGLPLFFDAISDLEINDRETETC